MLVYIASGFSDYENHVLSCLEVRVDIMINNVHLITGGDCRLYLLPVNRTSDNGAFIM
jgi:hypothetical protein